MKKETGSEVAWAEIRDGLGKRLIWLGGAFWPQKIYGFEGPREAEWKRRNNELWATASKAVVEDVRAKLAAGTEFKRENAGEYSLEEARALRSK